MRLSRCGGLLLATAWLVACGPEDDGGSGEPSSGGSGGSSQVTTSGPSGGSQQKTDVTSAGVNAGGAPTAGRGGLGTAGASREMDGVNAGNAGTAGSAGNAGAGGSTVGDNSSVGFGGSGLGGTTAEASASGGDTVAISGGSTSLNVGGSSSGGFTNGGRAGATQSAGGVSNGGNSTLPSGGTPTTLTIGGSAGTAGRAWAVAGATGWVAGGSGNSTSVGTSSWAGTAGIHRGVAGAAGTGAAGSSGSPGEEQLPEPFATAGLMELESRNYSYSNTTDPAATKDYSAASANLFYSFLPADKNAKSAPVFVFFNGGPGSATTGWLRSFGTATFTLAEGSAEPTQNPYSWTSNGNLLYIDARQTGFSYSTLSNPSDAAARTAEFAYKNFNIYADAGDFVRVLLRFLESQPALRNNPIVIVGESYGGIRATTMLNYLQHPQKLVSRGAYYYTDPRLADEIRSHYAAVFPNEDPKTIEGPKAARQFGWQVLIQPAIAYTLQNAQAKCNPAYALASRIAELGLPCPPTNQDAYDWSKPAGTSASLESLSKQALESVDSFTKLIGVDPRAIPGLPAAERDGAYRSVASNPAYDLASFVTAMGSIPDYDRYYLSLSSVGSYFEITGAPTAITGLLFLENLVDTQTFITRALLDSVIVADGIPDMLVQYVTLANPAPISNVVRDITPRTGVARPGWITVTYSGNSYGVSSGAQRVIRFPTYRNAGHMVSVAMPGELQADVTEFLSTTIH